jgi:putative transposase
MIVQRAHIYRLEPTPEQKPVLAQTAGACRALYNLALEQRMMWKPGRPRA